jgi:hypothetical protein
MVAGFVEAKNAMKRGSTEFVEEGKYLAKVPIQLIEE